MLRKDSISSVKLMSHCPKVTVAICTYKRPTLLYGALCSLRAQLRNSYDFEILVVDNDPERSARCVVSEFATSSNDIEVRYETEIRPGVSHVRNRAVACSLGDWIAFLDDDEKALPHWLDALLTTAEAHESEAVLGPVYADFPDTAPAWLKSIGRRVPSSEQLTTGAVPPVGIGGCGNALFRRSALLSRGDEPFLPALGRSGGEDTELFGWFRENGLRIVWCAEAKAVEHISPARMRLTYYLSRNMRTATVYWRLAYAGKTSLQRFKIAVIGVVAGPACILGGLILFPVWATRGAALALAGVSAMGRVLALTSLEFKAYG